MVLLEHVLYYSIIENYFHRVLLIRPEAAEASKIWGSILFKRLCLSASVLFSIPAKPWIWIPAPGPPPHPTVLLVGFNADIFWESRCCSEINV